MKTDSNSKGKLKNRSKEIQKKREEDREAELNISQDLRNRHIANQSKEVRKRMKKNKKRAEKHNMNKRDFFLFRWYEAVKIKVQTFF